jgi:hypothetical protein
MDGTTMAFIPAILAAMDTSIAFIRKLEVHDRTIDANQARLTIEGATTDRAHWFLSQIVASRIN